MHNQHIIDFFHSLAERMYKENDLSDVVYALCESCRDFRQFFLDFFFESGQLLADEVTILREVPYDDGSRPDFTIRHQTKGLFLVENKIDDHNHHFEQYVSVLTGESPDAVDGRLGYITNYELNDAEKEAEKQFLKELSTGRVLHWNNFIQKLKQRQQMREAWAMCEAVQGFLDYCSILCPDRSEEKVPSCLFPNDLSCVKNWYKLFGDSLSKIDIKDLGVTVARYRKSCRAEKWTGYYFSADNVPFGNGMTRKIYGWVGFYLQDKPNARGLCIEFSNKQGWGAPVFEAIREYANKPDIVFCFDFVPLDASLKEMQQTLEERFKKVFDSIRQGKGPDPVTTKTQVQLIQLRKLCLFLKQNVLSMLEINPGYVVEAETESDSQVTDAWCGVYFNVKDTDAPSRKRLGWLGVYYDGKRRGEDIGDGRYLVCDFNGTVKLFKGDYSSGAQELEAAPIKEWLKTTIRSLLVQSGDK